MATNSIAYTQEDRRRDRETARATWGIYWACLKPSLGLIIAALILTALDAVSELLIPYFTGLLINDGLGQLETTGLVGGDIWNQPAMMNIWLYGGLMAGLAILAIVLQTFAMKVDAKISADFAERLRNTLYWKMEQFSFSNIGHFPVAKMTTMLTNDTNNIRFFVLMLTRAGFKAPIMIVVSFCFIFSINWLIGLITIPFSLAAFFFICAVIWKTRPMFISMQSAIDDVNSNVEEDTEAIREVKAFCREEHMEKKFAQSNQDLTDISYKSFVRIGTVMGVTTLAISLTIAIIQYFGGWSMIMTAADDSLFVMFNNGSQFNAGELSMLSNFAAALTSAFGFLSNILQHYGRAEASKNRLDKVLQEPIDISYAPKPATADFDPNSLSDGRVEFRDVGFTYVGDLSKMAVGPISMEIESGKTIGIVGGTGSGKSSLVNLIPRLYDASTGEVLIAGHPIKDYSVVALRRGIGVVLQQNVLFTGTIRSNIRWGKPDATDEEIWEALEIAEAADFVRSFNEGLDTPVTQGGRSVSGGQKQRLCIARAIIGKPRILILDDSTSACDMETERRIKRNLSERMRDTTVFIIAQRITSVYDADTILVLDNGAEVGRGTHQELLQNCPIYQEIDAIQRKGVA